LRVRADRLLVVLALGVLAVMALGAASASANNRFVLDAAATSAGNLAEDAAGNAYVGWMDEGTPKFCKIPAGGTCTSPIVLPLHGSHPPDQLHPVLGSGSTVYLVGPSYDGDDVEIWTSTNGGASFAAPVESTGGFSDKTEPNSVLLSGSDFLIGSSHPSAGFGETPVSGGTGTNFEFTSSSGPYSLQSNLALAAPGDPVEVWWEYLNSSPVQFSRYKGTGSLTSESDGSAPATVTKGEVPRLAGGASGLFLLSNDYGAGSEATQVDVRKYSTTGFTFGTPLTLSSGPAYDFQDGGAIAESPSGLTAVAWPQPTGESGGTMYLYVSSDGGASFAAVGPIAHIDPAYEDGDNAQLTINDAGGGWLTYLDEGGLEVADLTPVPAPPAPAPIAAVTPVPTKKTTPKAYSGATKTFGTPVGGEELQLKVPKECLATLQPFYVGVGKAKRHGIAKALRTPIEVQKMTFSFDHLKKTLKKKPFRWLIEPPALIAGHKYLVKSRVTVTVTSHGKKKSVVKTLKGAVSIC
jgi:hypothetical protein